MSTGTALCAWASLLATLAGCSTPAATPGPAPRQHDVRYRCAGGVELEVSYLNPPAGGSYASFRYQGGTAVLRSLPSASGVRYVDQDEQRGLRWHTKGDAGWLAVLPPDHTASETPLLTDCRVLPAR